MKTLWFEKALLPGGWARDVRVTIDGGCFKDVESDCDAVAGERQSGVALPGIGNVHSHGFQRGMAGLGERRDRADDDFWSWREVMYRFLDRLTPDDVAAITAQAYVEMLEHGYTRVGEFHYLHHAPDGAHYADIAVMAAAIIEAAHSAGIGLTLLPVFYEHGGFGRAAPSQGQRRFLNKLDDFARLVEASEARLSPGDVLGIAPHSLRAVAPAELAALASMKPHVPFHIHAAEQEKEVTTCVAALGARPVEWLLANHAVDQRWCLIHATHMNGAECDALAASGAIAGLCPVTEANLGDGIFPAVRYLTAGGRFAIGSDSNILIDASGELRALEYSQRLHHKKRAVLADLGGLSAGRRLLQAAVSGGGQALGVRHGIAPGAPADLVTLDADHPALAGRRDDTLIDAFLFASGSPIIDSVWSGGKHVVKGGRHRQRDAVAARYRKVAVALAA